MREGGESYPVCVSVNGCFVFCVLYTCVLCACVRVCCVSVCEHECVCACEGLWLSKMMQQRQPQWMNLKLRGNEYIKGGQCLHSRGFY